MRRPPPGMNNMPKNAGETKAQYMERVRASKPTGSTPVGPRTQGASKPIAGGGKPSGLSPIPPKPPKPTVTTPTAIPTRVPRDSGTGAPKPRSGAGGGAGVKGGVKRPGTPVRDVRGPAPRPGFGGGKPKRPMK